MTVTTQIAPHSIRGSRRNPVPGSARDHANWKIPRSARERRSRKVGELSERHAHMAALIASCAAGDRAAFGLLYGQSVRFVFAVVRSVLGDSMIAEEVTQEIYVTIWRRASSFDIDKGSPLAWIGTISRNRAIDTLRAERARGFVSYSADVPDFASHDQSPDLTIEIFAMRRALAELRPDFRNAILLSYFKGYTHVELAVVMGVPMGTAKSWLQRGLAAMNKALQ